MSGKDDQGDLYEYLLSKVATSGTNGQFRTPRHIVKMMVELMKPTPKDIIVDPAAGTSGFLVAAGEYLQKHHANSFHKQELKDHYHKERLARKTTCFSKSKMMPDLVIGLFLNRVEMLGELTVTA